MAHGLESAKLKVRRAHEHVPDLNPHIQRWLKGEPYRVRRDLETDSAEHVYRLELFAEPPPYLGTIIGDVAHNLMSALDSIAWDLSASAIPTLSESDQRSIGYPIAKDAQSYNAGPIRFASKAAQAKVEWSQPYNGQEPTREPLWIIKELDRIDKHRYVIPFPALSIGSQWIDPGIPHGEITHPIGPLEDGAELARFTFETPQPEVDMQFRPMIDVALGDRPPARYVLYDLVEHVETVIIPLFEPFFP